MTEALFKVVDFSTHMSGPLAAHLLRAAGADVVRVEHPSYGDGNRAASPFIAGTGNAHAGLSGGVRSVTASTHSAEWPTLVRAAAQWADAVIVGGRQEDMVRRGLDFATIKKHNSRAVYCHITGYGHSGPWANKPAHGQNVDALAGRVRPVIEDGHLVTPTGMRTAGTVLAGVFGAMGTLAALVKRGVDGPGEYVHSSLWHAAMWWSWRDANMLVNEGKPWHEYRDMGSRYAIYETADSRALLLCPVERKYWEAFCDVAGMPPELRGRGDWSGGMEWGFDDEVDVISEHVRRRTLEEWVDLLTQSDVPFSPVLNLEEAINSDHAREVGLMVPSEVDGRPTTIMSTPWQHAASPDLVATHPVPGPPRLGEHSSEILREWGLTDLDLSDVSAAPES